MDAREFSESADFAGGITENAFTADDCVAACGRVHENAFFLFHSREGSLEQFKFSTQFAAMRCSECVELR